MPSGCTAFCTIYSEPVRLSEIAEREGLTQTYLSHLFREQLHIPFQDYLGRLRLEAAMLLLRQSDTTLTDAAYACGFSDPKYLNQSFLECRRASGCWKTARTRARPRPQRTRVQRSAS